MRPSQNGLNNIHTLNIIVEPKVFSDPKMFCDEVQVFRVKFMYMENLKTSSSVIFCCLKNLTQYNTQFVRRLENDPSVHHMHFTL